MKTQKREFVKIEINNQIDYLIKKIKDQSTSYRDREYAKIFLAEAFLEQAEKTAPWNE